MDNKAEALPVARPIYQVIVAKYFSENHFHIDKEQRQLEERIFESLPNLSIPRINLLRDYIKISETFIKAIASNHTTYEMLFWSRRLGPKNIFQVSDLSVMLYREIQTLSFYKYGLHDDTMTFDQHLSTIPKSLTEYSKMDYSECLQKILHETLPVSLSNTISDVIRVEILSYILLKGTQLYRVANKGSDIVIDKTGKTILSHSNHETSFLINLYDERLSKANLFSISGAFVTQKPNLSDPYFCPHFQLNVDHKIKVEIFNPKNEAYLEIFPKGNEIIKAETNYLLLPLNLMAIYDFLDLFRDEFYAHYSFSVVDFVLFLGYLAHKVVSDMSTKFDAQFQIMNRAYITASGSLDQFAEDFESAYQELHKIIFNKEIDHKLDVPALLSRFLLKLDNKNDIDLWTRGPKRFLYQVSDKYMLVDYTGITDIISYITKNITRADGEVGNRRAQYVEEKVESEIRSCYDSNDIWICRTEIRSGTLKREIDASFVIDDILFLLEVKAVNMSFGYDKGDKEALDFRTSKMNAALHEATDKGHFIKQNKNTLSVALPANVRFICPLVISTFPEYIWATDEELFISKKLRLPRILTIDDIKEFKKLHMEDVRRKKWIIRV